MSAKVVYAEVVECLRSAKSSMRCADLTRQLERLGFEIRPGKRGGHRIVVHDGLSDFYSKSFNCGHGKNPEIKPAYVRQMLKLLNDHEQELLRFLEARKDD